MDYTFITIYFNYLFELFKIFMYYYLEVWKAIGMVIGLVIVLLALWIIGLVIVLLALWIINCLFFDAD